VSNHDNFNLSDRAHLEQMSTAELEGLLRASVHPDSQMDESTILLILEVLEARNPAMQPQEVAAAWERFEREVIDAPQTAQTEDETDIEIEHKEIPLTKKRRSFSKILGTAAIIVVVLFAAGSLIPTAEGTNFWVAILDWTRETFGFGNGVEEWGENEIPEQLAELNNQMLQHKLLFPDVIPHYIPEGYEAVTTVVDEREDVTVFLCQLQNGDNMIVFQYRLWKDNDPSAEVQKSEEFPEEYKSETGQMYYIAKNEGLYNAKWTKGNIEGSILNVSTQPELIKILDSIQGD
jgi:hypothetical protein